MTHFEELQRQGKLEPVDAVSIIYNKLAVNHAQKGEWNQAIVWQLKARQVQKDVRGLWHHEIGSCSNALALMCIQGGRFKKAVGYLYEGLVIFRANGTQSSAEGILCLNFLAMCYTQLGQLDLAIEMFHRLVKLYEKEKNKNNSESATAHSNLGAAYLSKHTPEGLGKAHGHLANALTLYNACTQRDLSGTASCLHNITLLYSQTNQCDTALSCCREAVETLKNLPEKEGAPLLVGTYITLARACAYAGKKKQAVAAIKQALQQELGKEEASLICEAQEIITKIRTGQSVDLPKPAFQFSLKEMMCYATN